MPGKKSISCAKKKAARNWLPAYNTSMKNDLNLLLLVKYYNFGKYLHRDRRAIRVKTLTTTQVGKVQLPGFNPQG